MAKLYFRIGADFDKVIKLREEIDKLKNELKNMNSTQSPAAFNALNIQLGESTKNMNLLISDAAKAGAVMENDFRKGIYNASQEVNNLTESVINQKERLQVLRKEVESLSAQYQKAGKWSTAGQSIVKDLNAKKAELNGEKQALQELVIQQQEAKLSVKRLKDEYSLYKDESKAVITVNEGIGASFKNILATIGGAAVLKKFVADVVNVRGEFQKTQMSFETMLGSKEKADHLMAQMVETAAKTPFDLKGVANGAKQLLAYGTAAEDVNNTLVRLGNIASGLSIPLGDMVYLYGTTQTQGRLFTQDVRQFMGRGIPLVKELASILGKTEEEINKMVTAGRIGFPEVEKVIKKMTDEGGKFYNLMQKQSETLSGQISNLGEAWDRMLNSIGEDTQGLTSKTIAMATSLIEHYEEIGKVLTGLIAVYGTYKAALILNIALEKAQAVQRLASIKGITTMKMLTDVLTGSVTKLNAALAGKGFALIGAAAVGSSLLLLNWANGQDKCTEAVENFNRKQKEATDVEKRRKQIVEDAIAVASNEKKSTKERADAIEMLKQMYKNIIPEYEKETFLLKDILGYKTKINEEDTRNKRIGVKTKIVMLDQEIAKYEAGLKEANKQGAGQATQGIMNTINNLKKERELYSGLLNDIEKEQTASPKDKKVETKNKEFWANQKKEAETALDAIASAQKKLMDAGKFDGIPQEVIDQYKQAIKLKAEAEKELKVYDSSSKQDSEAEKLRQQREKLNQEIEKSAKERQEAIINSEFNIQQTKIDLMEEGADKELAQIQLNYERQYKEISDRERWLLEKIQEEEKKRWEKDNPDHEKKGTKFTPTTTSLSPEQRESFDKEYSLAYQKQEKDTQNLLDKLLAKYRDYDAQRSAIEKDGNAEIAYLQSKRTDANANEIDRAIQVAKQKMKEGVQAVNDAEAEETSKDNSFLRNLFGDTSQMAFKDLQNLIDQAKQLQSYLSGSGDSKGLTFISPEQLKTIEQSPDELDKLKKALDKLLKGEKGNEWEDIFDGFTKGFAKLKSSKSFKETSEALQDIGESASKASSMIGGVAGNLASMFEAMGNTGAAEAMTTVQDAMSSISNIGQGFAKGGPIGGIAAAVGEAVNWIGKAFAANARHKAALKEIMNETIAQQREYNLLLMQQNLEYEKASTIFGTDVYGKAANAVTVMKDAVADLNEELRGSGEYEGGYIKVVGRTFDTLSKSTRQLYDSYAGLANIEIKTGHKKTGLFGWGKGKDIYSSILDVYPNLIDENDEFNASLAETILNTKTMSDESKNALQNMIDLANQEKAAFEAVNDYMTDIFGDLGTTMMDALVDSFKSGTDSAQAFTDSVSNMLETLGKQMIYSATLGTLMEGAQKKMMDVMKNADLSDEEKFGKWTEILDGLADDAIEKQELADKLLEEFKQMAAEKGFDIFQPGDTTKEAFDSFISQMKSAFTSLDVTAKDVSDNIYDYFRQAMINALYEKEYKGKMEELYNSFTELSKDGLSESDMAKLGSQVDQYIEQMMKGVEDVNGLFADKLKDAEDLQSFVDNVKSAMSNIEATAEDVTDNIFEYIRQQMIDKMFADTFQPQIEAFYKKVQEAMSDGDVTDAERNALRSEAEKLANDIVAAKDILSGTLGITESNLKKELEEEFKSFSDGILNSLTGAEVTAEAVAKNISESMRKELIEAMYVEQYEPRIKAIWAKWKEYSEDGLVTDEERANIKSDINELSKEVADAAGEISDAWKDSGEEVKKAFDSFSDSIKSVLYDAETTAEDVANNIYKFMRNALVDSMFAAQLQPQIQKWYDQYTKFMEDGAIDTAERKTLDEMIAEIQKAGMEIVDAANGLFPSLDTGAIKRAEEAAQEAENARNEAEQEWESFSDDILNSLYDIEATAEDISDDMGEYMRKALIKAMYVENFKPQMQKWYNAWKSAMGDDNLTSEEKQMLDSMKQTMVDDMKKEIDAINQFFGSMFSQKASSKGFEGMSQDTGEELNGRFTALQIAGEEIRNQAVQQTGLLSSINNRLSLLDITNDDIPALMSGTPNIADRARETIASSYQSQITVIFPDAKIDALTSEVSNLRGIVDELRTFQIEKFTDVAEGVTKMSKNTPELNNKLNKINENIKRVL